MRENLAKAKQWLLQDEGNFDNDPDDPGGPTKYGITIYDYRSWFKKPQATAADVERLTIEEAFEIYEERYWKPCSCDLLPSGIDYFTYDSGMLSGTGTAIRWLQRAIGAVPDGIIGPKTLAALGRDHPLDVLAKMEALRRMRLRTLPTWWKYGRGWTNRVNKSVARAKKLIADAPNAEKLAELHPTPALPAGDASPRKAPILSTPEEVTLDGNSTSLASGAPATAQGGQPGDSSTA